jgi:hypothetical protein
MYKVSLLDDKELDLQKLMYILSANSEFIPSQQNQRIYTDPNRWLHSAIIPLSYTPDIEVDLLTPNDVLQWWSTLMRVSRMLGKGIFGLTMPQQEEDDGFMWPKKVSLITTACCFVFHCFRLVLLT